MAENNNKKTVAILFAFLCMGFGDAVGPLADLVKSGDYGVSNFQASLVTFMGFIMFGVLSIPLGLFQDRKGKKIVLMLGLGSALTGMVIPTFLGISSYYTILASVLFLGAGNAILQVAGNPIMRDVSPEGKYSRNLSLGQFIKAIGTLSSVLIPIFAASVGILGAKFAGKEWWVLFPIYAAGILVATMFIGPLKIKEKNVEESEPATFKSCMSLLKNRYVLMMVMAIFFYVGAEVSLTSNLGSYFSISYGLDLKEQGLWGTLFFIIALLIGRFTASIVLNFIPAKKFLIISAITALVGLGGLYLQNEKIAFVSAFIIGLGFANVFPLVFSIAIDKMPERANELSGLMVTAILGGAFVPVVMGLINDAAKAESINNYLLIGMLVPVLCFVYILIASINNLKTLK
jgi:fucose permease